MQIHKISSLFGTIMIGETHGEALSWISHFSSRYHNYVFTTFYSRMYFLYNPMIDNGDYNKI